MVKTCLLEGFWAARLKPHLLQNRLIVRASAARERAKRAQRAKRRKDTASSHEQVQRATCSSVRRHVSASLFMKTRFPFTYQTGFINNSFVWFYQSVFRLILSACCVIDSIGALFSYVCLQSERELRSFQVLGRVPFRPYFVRSAASKGTLRP